MISTFDLARDYSYPWEYRDTPDNTPTVRQHLDRLLDHAENFSKVAENLMKFSVMGALASSAGYVAIEALTRSNSTKEALLVFATALSLGLAAREQLREPDTSSLVAWRRRDRS